MMSDTGSVDIGSYTVTGLENDTRYQFEVRAVNAGGKGPASNRVDVTPKGTPAAPTGLVANSANASVILHWDYGNNDDITRYQYRWRITGSSSWNSWTDVPVTQDGITFHPSNITSVTVTDGMANDNLEREFEVRARNSNGWGARSKTSNAVKPEAPQAAPQKVTVSQDWPDIPDGVKPGDKFRLLFEYGQTEAESTRINFYNEFVQGVAETDLLYESWLPFKDELRAVISTAAVSARENIGETPPEAATYWAGGGMVVGPYFGDLFEDDWINLWQGTPIEVWTGTWHDGRSAFAPHYHPYVRHYAGAKHVIIANPADQSSRIADLSWGYPNYENGANPPANDRLLYVYGISPVITVSETECGRPTLTADFADGDGGCWNERSLDKCSTRPSSRTTNSPMKVLPIR